MAVREPELMLKNQKAPVLKLLKRLDLAILLSEREIRGKPTEGTVTHRWCYPDQYLLSYAKNEKSFLPRARARARQI